MTITPKRKRGENPMNEDPRMIAKRTVEGATEASMDATACAHDARQHIEGQSEADQLDDEARQQALVHLDRAIQAAADRDFDQVIEEVYEAKNHVLVACQHDDVEDTLRDHAHKAVKATQGHQGRVSSLLEKAKDLLLPKWGRAA